MEETSQSVAVRGSYVDISVQFAACQVPTACLGIVGLRENMVDKITWAYDLK